MWSPRLWQVALARTSPASFCSTALRAYLDCLIRFCRICLQQSTRTCSQLCHANRLGVRNHHHLHVHHMDRLEASSTTPFCEKRQRGAHFRRGVACQIECRLGYHDRGCPEQPRPKCRFIPGALRIPTEDLPTRYEEIPRDREIVLFCT